MANMDTARDLDSVIKVLTLEKYYPEKLTSQDLFEITELSINHSSEITPDTISWHFINHLTRYNYNARGLRISGSQDADEAVGGYLAGKRREKHENAANLHPLDVLTAVFLCCDPVAKQDLARYLWGCKLAIPFILYSKTKTSSTLHVWPLRSLISQWQDSTEMLSIEDPIISYKMQKIAFIRYGESNESKSALINSVIGGPEKAHPMFFHRDMNGSKKERSLFVDGMVELGWYLQKGDKTDRFDCCLMFANMRGDAINHPNHVKVLCQLVNVLVIITKTQQLENLDEKVCTMINRHSSLKIILVLTDSSIKDKHTARIELFVQKLQNNIGEHPIENRLEILTNDGKRLAERTEALCHQIKSMLSKEHSSIAEFAEEMTNGTNDIEIEIDESSNKSIRVGIQKAYVVTNYIKHTQQETRKSSCLPLQAELSHWMGQENKHPHFDTDSRDGLAEHFDYPEQITLKKIRKKQQDMLSNLHPTTRYFVWYTHVLKTDELRVFLRNLKLTLDQFGRQALQPFYEKYQKIVSAKTTANREKNEKLNNEIEELENLKAELSIGLEHLCREVGQVFECCDPSHKISVFQKPKHVMCDKLPSIAARILLMGYPFEIMDGDAGFVAEKWVSAVLKATEQILENEQSKKVKIHIVSVLGIQSSGKSTLLNAMFGPLFAVSAGRCTKGVFMQMIKINDTLRKDLKCDYLVLVDTEGLRSAKLDSVKFDNILSCFSIGLADMTLVNLMGENATYLKENLPVVVHAFLRMDMVGLKPLCTIVHQNVDKKDKKKLIEQGQLLERILNELTAKACDIEKITPPKSFNEMIKFHIDEYTDYIPSLFEGEQPMAPVSLGYSQECDLVRSKIVHQIQTHSRRITLGRMDLNIRRLWDAIRKDDFVFAFKSILEAEAKVHLDQIFCEICRESFSEVELYSKDVVQKSVKQDGSSPTGSDITDITAIEGQYHSQCSSLKEDVLERINRFMFETPVVSRLQWKDEYLARFDKEFEEARNDGLEKSRDEINDIKQKSLAENVGKEQIELIKNITTSDPKIDVNTIWTNVKHAMIGNMKKQTSDQDVKQIEIDVSGIVATLFPQYHNAIKDTLATKSGETCFSFSEMPETGKDLFKKYGGSKIVQPFRKLFPGHKKNVYEEFVQRIFNETKEHLDETVKRPTYSKSEVRKFFLKIKNITEVTKLPKKLIVDILIIVRNEVTVNMGDSFDIKNKLTKLDDYLEENKARYISTIKHVITNDINQQFREVMKTLTSMVKAELIRKSKRKLVVTMVNKLSLNMSKSLLFTRMMLRAVASNDMALIDMYCKSPVKSVFEYLTKYCICPKKLKDYSRITFNVIEPDIRQLLLQIPISPGDDSLNLWVNNVSRELNFGSHNAAHIPVLFSGDVEKMRSELLNNISSRDILMHLESIDTDIKREISRKVVDKYLGCTVCCPFCNEMCKFRNKDHPQPHESLMHRPIASKGYHYRDTKQLAVGTCDMFVAGRCSFKHEETYIPFKDFKSVYKDWEIPPSKSSESSTFWKWYFVQRKEQILALHDDLLLEVPEQWKTITIAEVIESLQDKENEYSLIPDYQLSPRR